MSLGPETISIIVSVRPNVSYILQLSIQDLKLSSYVSNFIKTKVITIMCSNVYFRWSRHYRISLTEMPVIIIQKPEIPKNT